MTNMRQQAERFGAVIVDDEVLKVDFKKRPFTITTHAETYTAEASLDAQALLLEKSAFLQRSNLAVEESQIAPPVTDHFSKARILL